MLGGTGLSNILSALLCFLGHNVWELHIRALEQLVLSTVLEPGELQ